MGVLVFNPDDEDVPQQFNGAPFVLHPGTTEIKSPWPEIASAEVIAQHMVTKQGKWGVAIVKGKVSPGGRASDPADAEIVEASKRAYLLGTAEWAHAVLLEEIGRQRPLIEAGLTGKTSDDAKKAKAWLDKHAKDLSKAGITD